MLNPIKTIFKPIRPDAPPPQQYNYNYGQPQEEKPWAVWEFVLYIIVLAVLWLVAKPVMDALVTGLIEPLSIAGYLDFFYNAFVWIFFIGMLWVGFSNTFRRGQ